MTTQELWRNRTSYDQSPASASPNVPPSQSFRRLTLNFSQNQFLREQYMNLFGGVRVGKILEDLDALAGNVAHAHCSGQKGIEKIVTASVDRIILLKKLDLQTDIHMAGSVSYVGNSSMEVTISLTTGKEPTLDCSPSDATLLVSAFTMVAVGPNKKPTSVPQLLTLTDSEVTAFQLGQQNHKFRKQLAESSLARNPPTHEESSFIHQYYLNYPSTSKDMRFAINKQPCAAVDMDSTRLSSVVLCQPQERNTAGNVFGGFLLAKAQELAWSAANLHCPSDRAWFVALDHVAFRRPVEIGSIVKFESEIIYTTSQTMTIKVNATAVHLQNGKTELATTFFFTFTSASVVPVVPRTYDDVVDYVEGLRRYNETQRFASSLGSEVLKPAYGSLHRSLAQNL